MSLLLHFLVRKFRQSNFIIYLCLSFLVSPSLHGQQKESKDATGVPALPAAQPHHSSIGIIFNEIPGTPVFLAVCETRVSDWNAFLQDSKYEWAFKTHFPQGDNHPAVNISLRDALKYCEWLTQKERAAGTLTPLQSYRLPTAKEWDAAVGLTTSRSIERATSQKISDEQTFPWGLEWPPPRNAGNFNSNEINGTDDGYRYTSPVGSFSPTKDGFFDLAGNAWEWTWESDGHSETTGRLRGGSWMYFRKENLLSSYQYEVPVDLHAPSVGFRLVMEDKHRTAEFLTRQENVENQLAMKRRTEMLTRPSVDAEEVAKVKEAMLARLKIAPKGITLPDPKNLVPAKPGDASFMNTLGMNFRPAGTEDVLFSIHETRVQDYQIFLAETGGKWVRQPSFNYNETHPIMNVSWQDAKAFCEWLTKSERSLGLIPQDATYRLPTDLEWSAAVGLPKEKGDNPSARHLANKVDYPWGQQPVPPPSSANLDTENMAGYQDRYSHTAPVGSFSPNSYGLFDMAGNVAEWCQDPWPGSSGERVLRGSSFLSSTRSALLSSARQHAAETMTRSDAGFRCVLELKPR